MWAYGWRRPSLRRLNEQAADPTQYSQLARCCCHDDDCASHDNGSGAAHECIFRKMKQPDQSLFNSGTPKPQRFDMLQVLRGLAATLVAAFHLHGTQDGSEVYEGFFWIFARGEYGVDLFFVISGFIIFYTVNQHPDMTIKAFLAARFWRILPPYWAILGLYLLAGLGIALVFGDSSKIPDALSLTISVLLLPIDAHVIVPAWSLSLELIFYAIFAITYFRFGPTGLVAGLLAWIGICYGMQVWADRTWFPALLFFPIIAEFLFGVIVAWLCLRGWVRYGQIAFFAGLILFAVAISGALDVWYSNLDRSVIAGVPATLLLYGAVSFRQRMPEIIIIWGESSYIMYLIHLIVFSVFARLFEIFTGLNLYYSSSAMLAAMVIMTILSMALTYYIEQPYQKWYKVRWLGRAPA